MFNENGPFLLEGSSGEAVNFESKVLESTSVVRPRGLLFV